MSVEERCHDGRPCVEVTARIQAAERLRHVEHCDSHADQMLAQARRWAEVHNHGSGEASS